MNGKPDWSREGRDWPNRESSRFVSAGGLRWHVQEMGTGPVVLLLHGAGAATHSWRDLAPQLASHFRVVAPDLPGHGFTDARSRMPLSLPEMTSRLEALLERLALEPALVVGHSAGAAIGLSMVLGGALRPRAMVAINGALTPYPGFSSPIIQGLSRTVFANPVVAHLLARRARDPGRVARLIAGTGSLLDARGTELYERLFRTPGHLGATLGMMAHWDLQPLQRDLGALSTPLLLIVGDRDAAVPPSVADAVRAAAPGVEIVTLAGLGHLAHEERPDLVADVIVRAARDHGVLEAT